MIRVKSLLMLSLLSTSMVHASPSASHVGQYKDVMGRLERVDDFDFSRAVAKTPVATVLTEPVIRLLWTTQILTRADWIGVQGLAAIHNKIDPGGAEGDGSNLFVYSCKGGWLDLGHVINTALGYKAFHQTLQTPGLLRPIIPKMLNKDEAEKFNQIANQFIGFRKTATDGKVTGDLNFWAGYFAMRSGYHVEDGQTKTKDSQNVKTYDSNATSAYTLEDLPSDYYGIMIAERMERKHFVNGVVKSFRREVSQLMKDFRAVDFDNRIIVDGRKVRAEEILKKDAAFYEHLAATTSVPLKNRKTVSADPRSVYNFTVVPKKTLHHSLLCDGSGNPISK